MTSPPISILKGILLLTLAATLLEAIPHGSGTGQQWLIRAEPGEDPLLLADEIGALYRGPLEGVERYHRVEFVMPLASGAGRLAAGDIARHLSAQKGVEAFEEDALIRNYPRTFLPLDPRFPEQWHLENVGQTGGLPFADIRVRPVWDQSYSGSGVVVAIVDEGIEFRHPDLLANWLQGSGYDYNDDDSDPSPSGREDFHGTAVAGITVADANGIGGLGVAHGARFVPLRLIAGSYRRGEEAEALSYRRNEVDIYNNSWGPSDEVGVRYVDSSEVLKAALADNVAKGRNGLGNIYVWAAGNGGLNGDNSNYDGYNALPYTISVGAVGHDDIRAGYSEPGANLLVVAPSRGSGAGILTADVTGADGYAPGDYYENFGGTSAAAPIVSGVVALLLEARPDLGWRDVQQILALSASPVDFDFESWQRNGAGFWFSHEYGFGRVDASAALELARNWQVLGPEVEFSFQDAALSGAVADIPETGTLRRAFTVSDDLLIQHVQVRVRIRHADWGDLRVAIVSPSGTRSVLAEPHANANLRFDPGEWTYLSTHFLGEPSRGEWILEVSDEAVGEAGQLMGWNLILSGIPPPEEGNQPPVAPDLFVESTVFPLEIDVFEGVSDPEGAEVGIIGLQRPRHGSLETLGSGRYLFRAGTTKTGKDMFSVLLSDGAGGITRRLVEVLDPRPVVTNELYPVLRDTPVRLPVLRNDLDPDGDPLRITSATIAGEPSARVTFDAAGDLIYTPPEAFTGLERLRYEVTDDADGSAVGWATAIVQAEAEVALSFDGEDDHLVIREAPSLNTVDAFTAEAWIYPEDWGEYVTGFGRIFDRDTFIFFLNGFDHTLYNNRSLVAYFIQASGTAVAVNTVPGVIELGRWQHVAVSFDSRDAQQSVRIYVDGEPVEVGFPLENTSAPNLPLRRNEGNPLYMGESASGARAFQGRMTEFRIWDRVLPAAEIRQRHATRLTGDEPELALYLPLDQTLNPEAFSIGELALSAEIFEAQRIPLSPPWEDLQGHFSLIDDAGNGWWEERTFGWIFGDTFPWIYTSGLEWVFTGHSPGDPSYRLLRPKSDWGWLLTDNSVYPWLFHYETQDWFWYLTGFTGPGWFRTASGTWFTSDSPFPAE